MGEQQVSSLSYSVRGWVVLKYFGQLCTMLAALTSVTLLMSILFKEYGIAVRYAAVVCALVLSGALLGRLKAPRNIQANEALVITALVFLFTSLVMAFPMMASGLGFEDALFEAVSAITTTGLSTAGTIEGRPRAFLFARAWMQWVGGLGIVVLSIALLFRPGLVTRRLAGIDWEAEGIAGGTRMYARWVLKVYLALTGAGTLALVLLGVGWFPALVHTLSAVSTGGFSSYDKSIAGLGGPGIQGVVLLVSFSGAVSLALYHRFFRMGWRELAGDVEVKTLLLCALATACLLALCMGIMNTVPWKELPAHALLMAMSAQTTAGFSTLDVPSMDAASKLVLIVSMSVGGSVGSTAGGMKILRFLIMLKMMGLLITRTRMPGHAVVEPRLQGQRLEDEDIQKALLVMLLFILVIALSWLPFLLMGHNALDSLFEVVSAAGTVGLSSGVAHPGLSPLLKGVLCADMLMGRLEIIAVLVLLYPGTWFGRRVGEE